MGARAVPCIPTRPVTMEPAAGVTAGGKLAHESMMLRGRHERVTKSWDMDNHVKTTMDCIYTEWGLQAHIGFTLRLGLRECGD